MSTKETIAENFAPSQWLSWPRSSIRVVDWNIDRGLQLRSIIDFLGDTNADIFILQEVDINARRTHRVNVAQEIARKLRLNYVFGREFVELTQGSSANPAYHGQATLSRWKISDARIISFQQQSSFWKPRWYLPKLEPFQERLGEESRWFPRSRCPVTSQLSPTTCTWRVAPMMSCVLLRWMKC